MVMHRREYMLMSNSGHLAHKSLKNSKIIFRGHENKTPIENKNIQDPNYESFVLFPSSHPKTLSPNLSTKKPIQLIVPDGNWRQANKIIKSNPKLYTLPKVTFPIVKKSEYKLRVSPFDYGICTFEAIARAIGILEGKDHQKELEKIFYTFVERNLFVRGKLKFEDLKNKNFETQNFLK